ncbi:outer membrane protein assembly factor BamB [Candidatus Gillettellia adelgis]
MKLHKTLLAWLVVMTTLSSCSVLNRRKEIAITSLVSQGDSKCIPHEIWNASVGKGIGKFYSHLRPVFQNGVLFAADRYGMVKAMDVASGNEKWKVYLAEDTSLFSRHSSALLSGGLTVSEDKLYVSSEKAVVYALNITNGRIIWQSRVAGEAISYPVISSGIVLIHTSNGYLQALNESDGMVAWMIHLDITPLSLRGESSPAVAFGAAIVGSDNGCISAVLMQQGQLIWRQRIAQPSNMITTDCINDIDTTPVIVDDIIYAAGYNGNLTALELRSGRIIWKRDLGTVNDFIVNENRIYLINQNDQLVALRETDGLTVWIQNDLIHHQLTSPVIFNGYLVIGDATGWLHWINLTNGRLIAQQHVDRCAFLSAPVIAGDKLVIQARNGKVYAFMC